MVVDINDKKHRINIDEPRWDQRTYWGRARHFFVTTNPLNLLYTSAQLERVREVVTKYRKGENIPGLTEDELWRAKNVYDSAFHPETGEKMFVLGRMSAQVPMNMVITGCMLTFYKTTRAVVFWQWFNQSFNASVNYTNRSGKTPISVLQLGTSYVSATSCALVTSLGLNSLVTRSPPLIGRFVPFVAVAAANCVNIPLMRYKEIADGIPVTDKDSKIVGYSKVAAKQGIATVVLSRILMAVPTMILPPFLMDHLERKGTLARYPRISAPLQTGLCAVLLIFVMPLCCALFPQNSSISVPSLELDIQERVRKLPNPPSVLYFNKGL